MPKFELTDTLRATAAELKHLIAAYEADKTPTNKQALLECLKEKSSHAEYEVHRELAKLLHHYPALQKWFEWSELNEHWEEQLKSYYPLGRPDLHLLPQKQIISCHIVLGWACFKQFSTVQQLGRKRPRLFPGLISPARETRADGDQRGALHCSPLDSPSPLTPPQAAEISHFKHDEDKSTWLSMAIQYNNLLAIAERHLNKKTDAKKQLTWPEKQNAMQKSIKELLKTAPLHNTPGWLLLAQAYVDMALLAYAASDQPALAKSFLSADACRLKAQALEKSSEAEIRNVSFGSVETVITILFKPATDWESLTARLYKFQGIFFPPQEETHKSVEPPSLATVMAQMKTGRR